MAKLILSGAQQDSAITLGKSVDLVIVGGVLSVADCLLASYSDGAWHVGRHRFEKISYSDPVRIDIVTPAGQRFSFGPFRELCLAGPMVCSREGVLARYDPLEETWYFDRHGSRCDTIRVSVSAFRSEQDQRPERAAVQ